MDVTRLVSSSVENKYYFAEPNLIELGKRLLPQVYC